MLLAPLCLAVKAAPARDEEKPPPPAAKSGPSTLFVLVHVRIVQVRLDQIEATFKQAAENLSDRDADVHVQALEPQFYRALQNLTTRLSNPRPTGVAPGTPFVRQRGPSGTRTEWELHL